MSRCFELALKGLGEVAPNPMVGAVIVHNNEIIGEGYHKKFGEAHAEVNAIHDAIENGYGGQLSESTIYVNLEPCAHFGKTPPCSDLIITYNLKKVVISNIDPHDKVAGNGIKKIREAGIEVVTDILPKEGRELNRRFFTYHEQKRPYTILKFAQSADGFIAAANPTPENRKISNELSNKLVHQWRSEESAILVGTNTALIDNPSLTVRHYSGKNPLRIAIDRECRIPSTYALFDQEASTFIFNEKKKSSETNPEFIQIDFSKDILPQINNALYERQILSVLVEGGSVVHQQYIDSNLWDEIRVITAPVILNDGVKACTFEGIETDELEYGEDRIKIFRPIKK